MSKTNENRITAPAADFMRNLVHGQTDRIFLALTISVIQCI